MMQTSRDRRRWRMPPFCFRAVHWGDRMIVVRYHAPNDTMDRQRLAIYDFMETAVKVGDVVAHLEVVGHG